MTRRTTFLVTLVAVVTVVATMATGALATSGVAADGDPVTAASQVQTDGATQTQGNDTVQGGDEGNLTGENETAVVEANESATREANLTNQTEAGPDQPERRAANQTFPARQTSNGTFQVDGATGVYDYAVVTARNGTVQLFVRNMTVATDNGTTTMLNTFVAIGDNLSQQELRRIDEGLRQTFENDTAADRQVEANVSAVTVNETVNATAMNETVNATTPNGTVNATAANETRQAGNDTATAASPQVRDLGLTPLANALASDLPDSALEQQSRVKVDVANVRANDTARTYRNVLLRGTLRDILDGQAETAEPTANRTADTDVQFERTYFDVSNLEAPDSVGVGETFQVSATVTNNGSDAGAEEVSLRIAGEQQQQELVRLEPGESTTVSFGTNLGSLDLSPGVYRHGVYAFGDSETAMVTVEEPRSQDGEQVQTQNETRSQDGDGAPRPDESQDNETEEEEGDPGAGGRPEPQPQE